MRKIILVAFLLIGVVGCNRHDGPPPSLPKHVDAEIVTTANIPYMLDYPGVVSGVADFPVYARVNGTIFKQLYVEGTLVKKDQPLYEIDPGPFENDLHNAEGQMIKDKAAMTQYKLILDRYKRLYKVNAVSEQDIETADINYEAAVGLVKADAANIAQAKLNITYCKVLSPVDGLVSEHVVTVGQMVAAYTTVLTNVNSADNMYINFSVPENDRLALQKGVNNGTVQAPKDYKFSMNLQLADGTMLDNAGLIAFFDTRISLTNGTWNMRGNIYDNSVKYKLLSGQFIHVYLTGAYFKDAIAVPQDAIFRDSAHSFVYVLDNDNKIIKQIVEVGVMAGNLWIVNSGLKTNDKVVINGGMKVMPGDKVIVDSVKQPAKQA